ncbi:MAG: carboxypeptidase M32, partial [Candidatus Dormibacteraceae bacterium]
APPDADGCLQDIHWTFSILGSFVGYSLGNLIAAQIMERVRRELPELDQQVAEGQFAPLLQWLQTNLYRHGRKFTPPELVKRITGGEISAEPWRRYIEEKYRPLYGL